MAKRNFKSDLEFLLYINLSILILLLSIFNVTQKPKTQVQVLGAKDDNSYWEDLVTKHPTYRDAWVELGRIDQVKQIDPNYLQP